MKCPIALAACLLTTTAAWAQVEDGRPFVFVGGSSEECGSGTSDPWVGQHSLYIWMCGGFNTFSMTEFGIATTFQVVDLIPAAGVTNIGTMTSPTLIYPQCEFFIFPLAELVVVDASGSGGHVCLTDSATHQMNCTQECGSGQVLSNVYSGFSSDGSPPCSGTANSPGCYAVAVDRPSWGSVKSQYR